MLIGIGYKKGHGKDTVASLIKGSMSCGVVIRGFAYQLKLITAKMFPSMSTTKLLMDDREYKEKIIPKYGKSPRQILQEVGVGMRNVYEDFWVEQLVGSLETDRLWNAIIPDVRFPNEVAWIKKEGGILLNVIRPNQVTNDTHISETALDNFDGWDYTIINDGTLDDLKSKVDDFINKVKLK